MDLRCLSTQTVLEAKRALSGPTVTPIGKLTLLHGGTALADHSTLAQQGLDESLVEVQLIRKFDTAPTTERAAQVGDAVLMAYVLECGADPNQRKRMGRNALHWAAGRGDLKICRLLLDCPTFTSINGADHTGQTALHLSALAGSIEVVHTILGDARFTAANRSDGRGRTALHLAAGRGHAAVCRALLASGKFSAREVLDESMQTAYDLALSNSHPEICQLLC